MINLNCAVELIETFNRDHGDMKESNPKGYAAYISTTEHIARERVFFRVVDAEEEATRKGDLPLFRHYSAALGFLLEQWRPIRINYMYRTLEFRP